MRRTENFPPVEKALGLELAARAPNVIRILFLRVPKALDSRAINCFSTGDRGLGRHLEIIRNVVYLMRECSRVVGLNLEDRLHVPQFPTEGCGSP